MSRFAFADAFRCSSLFPCSSSSLREPWLTKRSCSPRITCFTLGIDSFLDLAHNKVLVAATVSTAIGQLSKPFTAAVTSGKGIDLKDAIRSGGMPSTHSAAVVAVATSLGFERGFSDSIFGMSAVFAAIVMYDAQGVRREVGKHAKVLNKVLGQHATMQMEENVLPKSKPGMLAINCEEPAAVVSTSPQTALPNISGSASDPSSGRGTTEFSTVQKFKFDAASEQPEMRYCYHPLSEAVGHTELQVAVGALLGFLASLITSIAL